MNKPEPFLALLSDAERTHFIEVVDESPYSLSEWKQSLDYFGVWLKQNSREKDFSDQVEYIACCIQGSANTGRLIPLVDLLKTYIENYGVH